jgi:putative membrane protein
MMMGLDLIFLVVIGGAIAYALGWRPQSNQTRPAHTGQTPAEILKARYVRGEITREEYEQIRQDLESYV